MRIYSDKWENVVLWDGDAPDGAVALNVAATEANLRERYDELIEEYCKKYEVGPDADTWTDRDARMFDQANEDAWRELWTPGNADDCYVWIRHTASSMGRKGGAVKSERKTAAVRENGRKGGRPRKVELKKEDVTLEMVKNSSFGCRLCLWAGVECVNYEKFAPNVSLGVATCTSYAYCD